jgi:hypothetical protein
VVVTTEVLVAGWLGQYCRRPVSLLPPPSLAAYGNAVLVVRHRLSPRQLERAIGTVLALITSVSGVMALSALSSLGLPKRDKYGVRAKPEADGGEQNRSPLVLNTVTAVSVILTYAYYISAVLISQAPPVRYLRDHLLDA